MKLGIVPYDSKSYWQAVHLRNELLRKPLKMKFTPNELEAEENQFHFVAMNEDFEVIATTLVQPLEIKKFKIRQVCVKQSQQGKGIGTQLYEFVESYLLHDVSTPIFLELHARENVIHYYEGLGFNQSGDRFIEIGIPHQKMTKVLGK